MGEYPGGIAIVETLDVQPDVGISFDVRHPTFGRMGVFDHEPVRFVDLGLVALEELCSVENTLKDLEKQYYNICRTLSRKKLDRTDTTALLKIAKVVETNILRLKSALGNVSRLNR